MADRSEFYVVTDGSPDRVIRRVAWPGGEAAPGEVVASGSMPSTSIPTLVERGWLVPSDADGNPIDVSPDPEPDEEYVCPECDDWSTESKGAFTRHMNSHEED